MTLYLTPVVYTYMAAIVETVAARRKQRRRRSRRVPVPGDCRRGD